MAYIEKELYDHFFNNLDQIIIRIVNSTSQSLNQQLSDSDYDLHKDLLHHLFTKIKHELDDHHSTEDINLDYDPADVLSEKGYDLNYIVMLISQFRLNALEEIEREFQEYGVGTLRDAFYFMHRMSEIFDQVVQDSTTHFNHQYQANLKKLEKELLLLSAPIVPVKEGVAVIPIIGSLNEERANHILEKVIPEVTESDIKMLIADFSGIHKFDEHVAARLFTIVRTLKLIGIQVIITGIRSEMVHTTIELGDTIEDLEIYRDVKKALEQITLI